jgi:hypothetical protein
VYFWSGNTILGAVVEDEEAVNVEDEVFAESSDERGGGDGVLALLNEGTLLLFFSLGRGTCLPNVCTDEVGDDGLELDRDWDWERASMTLAFEREYMSSIARLQSPWFRERRPGETRGLSYGSSSRGVAGDFGEVEREVEIEVEDEGGDAAADESGETDVEVDEEDEGGGGIGARRGCKNALEGKKAESDMVERREPEPGNIGMPAKRSTSCPSCFASETTIVSSWSKSNSSSSSHGGSKPRSPSSSSDSEDDMGDESMKADVADGGGIGNSERVEMETLLERLDWSRDDKGRFWT